MTRYGFAIKALPGGKKPFGDDEDDDEREEELPDEDTATTPPAPDAAEPPAAPDPAEEPSPEEPAPQDDAIEQPEEPADEELTPDGDARPWSGDMYDEGDESDPQAAFASYTGTSGEQAWLDQAPDGTLTGWVRDATGQVWRYTDADAWAIDVDDAQMTRARSRADTDANQTQPAGPSGTPGEQDPLFSAQ
ncbi:hypothetical protein ACIO3O_37340 [Streptomyces sp. NPDC087440]|uniref:hypothetical protein n=1 Tax=Streptomyces sp. NPDC087440 TaxID=3365790 RepID=UPI00381C285B